MTHRKRLPEAAKPGRQSKLSPYLAEAARLRSSGHTYSQIVQALNTVGISTHRTNVSAQVRKFLTGHSSVATDRAVKARTPKPSGSSLVTPSPAPVRTSPPATSPPPPPLPARSDYPPRSSVLASQATADQWINKSRNRLIDTK